MIPALSYLIAVVCWTPAIWLTVRVCDGTNEVNSLKAASGWAMLLNLVLAIPYGLLKVGIPAEWLAPMTVVFSLATLLGTAGIFWRYYDFTPTKSFVAIPVLGVSLVVVSALLGALAIGAAVAISGAGALDDLRSKINASGVPVEVPAIELPGREPPPEEPDLSEGIKPVKGMPGHYSYKDRQGKTHIVDSFDKVPEAYRR